MICESEFIIETDNRTIISWLKRIPINNLNERILKWQSYLSDYTYSTQYIEEKKNFLVDFLSRTNNNNFSADGSISR